MTSANHVEIIVFKVSESVKVAEGRFFCPKRIFPHAFPDLHMLYTYDSNRCIIFWYVVFEITDLSRPQICSDPWLPIHWMQAEERPTRESWGPVLVLGHSGRSLHAYSRISDR